MKRAPSSQTTRWTAMVAVAALVTLYSGSPLVAGQKSGVPGKADAEIVAHVLNRIGFGARPGDVARVQAMGLAEYIEQQLHPERLDDGALDTRLATFETLALSQQDLADKYFIPAEQMRRDEQAKAAKADAKVQKSEDMMMSPEAAAAQARAALPPEVRAAQQAQQNVVQELMQAKMLRAAVSERQLDEVLTDFWFNHFNVYVQKGQVRTYVTSYERDVIRPNVFANFRTLLGAVAHSPAMLFYLDNFQSAGANAAPPVDPRMQQRLNDPRIRPQQREQLQQRLAQMEQQQRRPARGLNENYGRELMELHTLGVDAGYTQKDVTEAARVLTGWTIDRPQMGGGFMFNQRMHDTGEKTVLGVRFPAGGGQDEGERLLDMLAKHPATAHHIAYKLAQRFVADEPPAALVDRAAKKFLDTKGDLREVTRVVITSPEFFAKNAIRAKVKTPFEFVVSALRATGANVVSAQPLVQAMRNLGMPLYGCQPPTGYSMTADAWVNTGALLNRMNFAVQLMDGGRIPPTQGRDGGAAPPGQPGPPNQMAGDPAMGRPAGPGRGQLGQPGQPGRPGQPGQFPGQFPNPGRGRGGMIARGPLQVDVNALAPDTSDASRAALIALMLAGQASDGTRQTLARADSPKTLIALTLGSPEFQRR